MKVLSIFIIFFSILLLSGCNNDKTVEKKKIIHSDLIREQGTDVASLDKNADGMVYQCPMDFQVVADSMTSCPVCKMDLEEFSVADAQKNLESHYH